MMIPENHRSTMKVVPICARQRDKGARIIVPKVVITSAAMCSARLMAVIAKRARQPRGSRRILARIQE